MAEAHHYRIEVTRLDDRGVEVAARPLSGGEALTTGLSGEGLLEDKWALEELLRWAEALPWPGLPERSGSYREDIFVERRDTGGRHGYLLEALNRHREDHTDSRFIADEDLAELEAIRDILQWAESLSTLT